MRRILPLILAVLLYGCGSSKSGTPSINDDAAAQKAYLEAGLAQMAPGLARFGSLLALVGNPGAPGSDAIDFQMDTSPGAPPNSYVFSIPLDGDGNGSNETMVTGTCRLSGDPAFADFGFTGSVDLTLSSMGGLGSFEGSFDFTATETGAAISGGGTFSESVTGNTTTATVDPAHPLVATPATGASGAVANACEYSLSGPIDLALTGPQGTLTTTATFSSNSRSVALTGAMHTDAEGAETPVPDSSYQIPCDPGSVADWAGVYDQDWRCIPTEYGAARLTLTVSGSTVHIMDEDPPGSGDVESYDAQALPGSPHTVHGFFIGGDGSYREDFTWTLLPDRSGFSQVSLYKFQSGSFTGRLGFCSAFARREP